MSARHHLLVREVAWVGCLLVGLALVACATFVGSWLLRFEWFSGLFRIPTEEVLIPFWFAVFTTPVVAASALAFWLARLLIPSVEQSRSTFLLAHFAALGVVLGLGLMLRPRAWSLLPILGLVAAAVLVGPRLLVRPLAPRVR
jgi:hypothetical protein